MELLKVLLLMGRITQTSPFLLILLFQLVRDILSILDLRVVLPTLTVPFLEMFMLQMPGLTLFKVMVVRFSTVHSPLEYLTALFVSNQLKLSMLLGLMPLQVVQLLAMVLRSSLLVLVFYLTQIPLVLLTFMWQVITTDVTVKKLLQ